MGRNSNRRRRRNPQTSSSQVVTSESASTAVSVDPCDQAFSRMAKFAIKGNSITKAEVRELKTSFGHRTTEMVMVLTLFDGAVMSGCIPASVESDDERAFITSYSRRVIAPALIGHDPKCQDSIDTMLSKFLDETSKDLSYKMQKLARNVNWATSVAICKAGAYANNMDSYKYVRKLLVCDEPEYKGRDYDIPDCVFRITDAAMHPTITSTQQHLLIVHKVGVSINDAIKRTKDICDSYFKDKITEDERSTSYTPSIQDIKKGLEELTEIIDNLGYKEKVSVGLDVGASQFYEGNDSYRFRCNVEEDNAHLITTKALHDVYVPLLEEYDLDYIEDAFHHTHWNYFSKLNYTSRGIVTVTGEKWKLMDDYMLEQPGRVCSSLLLKVSKAGSVTELIKFVTLNKYCEFGFVMDSHSCDSSDTFIADLCVGLMVERMKIGFSCATRKCKVCDRVNQILDKVVAKLRFLGIVDGHRRYEIDTPDTDEWDKLPSPIYD